MANENKPSYTRNKKSASRPIVGPQDENQLTPGEYGPIWDEKAHKKMRIKDTAARPQTEISTELTSEEQTKLSEWEASVDALMTSWHEVNFLVREYKEYLRIPEGKGNIVSRLLPLAELVKTAHPDVSSFIEEGRIWYDINQELEAGTLPKDQEVIDRQFEIKKETITEIVQGLGQKILELKRKSEARPKEGRPILLGAGDESVQAYYAERWKEYGRARFVIEEFEIERQKLQADLLRAQTTTTSSLNRQISIENLNRKLKELAEKEQAYSSRHPEAFLIQKGRDLKEMKAKYDQNSRVIETPYVKLQIQSILSSIRNGRPVFIYGELGTGKTELARYIAEKELSKPHLSRWLEAHPEPKKGTSQWDVWQQHKKEQSQPIVFSGHRNAEFEQLIASTEIKQPKGKSAERFTETLNVKWEAYVNMQVEKEKERLLAVGKNKKELEIELKSFRLSIEQRDKKPFERVLLIKEQRPAVVEKTLGPLLQAMKEGRPFILDEMNAIPHHFLILMNDLLMRKPGDVIQGLFAGMEKITVEKGFCVLATGNKKAEKATGLTYQREKIDPAFLSRFDQVSYDYLPMASEPRSFADLQQEREYRESLELYHMLLLPLLNSDTSADLPADVPEKLLVFAMAARKIQEAFTGRGAVSGTAATQDVLKENILSLRHLIPLLQEWQRGGFTRSFDSIVFEYYVERSSGLPEEKIDIYKILVVHGNLFPPSKGWPNMVDDHAILTLDSKTPDYRKKTTLREKNVGNRVHFSPEQMVQEFYGRKSARTYVDSAFINAQREAEQKKNEAQAQEELLKQEREEVHQSLLEFIKKGEHILEIKDPKERFWAPCIFAEKPATLVAA